MDLRRAVMFCTICVYAATAMPAFCCYSGLLLIPTADTVGTSQFSTELQSDGSAIGLGDEARMLNVQFGLGERCEAGLDYDYTSRVETKFLWNAKYVFAQIDSGKSATAVGLTNMGSHSRPSPYTVMSRDAGLARLHLGATRIDQVGRWFVGVDRAIGDRLTLMADYTSGPESFSSVGFSYQVNGGFGVMAGMEFPNTGTGSVLTLHFVFGGSCARHGKGG